MFAGNLDFAGLSPEQRVARALHGFDRKTVTVDTRGHNGPAITQALTVIPDNAPMKRTVASTLMGPQVGTEFANTPVQFVSPQGTPFGWRISDVWNFVASRVSASSPRGYDKSKPQVQRFAPTQLKGLGALQRFAQARNRLEALGALGDAAGMVSSAQESARLLKRAVDDKAMAMTPDMGFINQHMQNIPSPLPATDLAPIYKDLRAAAARLQAIAAHLETAARYYLRDLITAFNAAGSLSADQRLLLEVAGRDFQTQSNRIVELEQVIQRVTGVAPSWQTPELNFEALLAPTFTPVAMDLTSSTTETRQDREQQNLTNLRTALPSARLMPTSRPTRTVRAPVESDDTSDDSSSSSGSSGSSSPWVGGPVVKTAPAAMTVQTDAAESFTIPWWAYALGAGAVGLAAWKLTQKK